MSDETLRMVEAEAANQALRKYLKPAFDKMRSEYYQSLAGVATRPLTQDNIAALQVLAVGIHNIDRLETDLAAIVLGGDIAAADAKRVAYLASLTPEKRKWALW
jgi:hypothetical protein